jgi:hypothetical protein
MTPAFHLHLRDTSHSHAPVINARQAVARALLSEEARALRKQGQCNAIVQLEDQSLSRSPTFDKLDDKTAIADVITTRTTPCEPRLEAAFIEIEFPGSIRVRDFVG